MTSACCMCTSLFMRCITQYGFFTFSSRSVSQWMLTVKVETKCLTNLNTCVLQGILYCCEVWKQSIRNCSLYKTFTDFHTWCDLISLSLSTVPPLLPVQSVFWCDVRSLHILFYSVHPALFLLIARVNMAVPSEPGVTRYWCWSVGFYQHTKFEHKILKMWLLHF